MSLKRGLAGFIVPSKLYGILAAGRPFIAAVEADSRSRCRSLATTTAASSSNPATATGWPTRSGGCSTTGVAARPPGAPRAGRGPIYDRRRAVEAYRDLFEDAVA